MTSEILPYGHHVGRKHAIASMAFGFEFSAELTSDQLGQVTSLRDDLVEWLPGVKEKKSLKIDVNTPSKAMAEENLGAIIFESVRRDGTIDRALTVSSDSAFVNVNDYVSWADAWDFAKLVISKVLPCISKFTSIKCVGLQYVDRFISFCDANSFSVTSVLSDQASILPPMIYKVDGPWHSNNGYFYAFSDPFECKVLNNVNVSLAQHKEPYGEKRTFSQIEMNFIHRALFFESPRTFLEQESAQVDSDLDQLVSGLHQLHKKVIADMLSDDMIEKIGLND